MLCDLPRLLRAELYGGPEDGLVFSLPAPVPAISFVRTTRTSLGDFVDRVCVYARDDGRWTREGQRIRVPYKFSCWE